MRNDKSKKTATAWLLATALVVGLPQLASAETVLPAIRDSLIATGDYDVSEVEDEDGAVEP